MRRTDRPVHRPRSAVRVRSRCDDTQVDRNSGSTMRVTGR
jgi:hypothetical protein